MSAQELSELIAPLWALLNRRSSADLFQIVGELNSSFSQVKMLFLLEDGARALRQGARGAASACRSPPRRGRSTDSIDRGYVARRECEEDRRSRLIALTPAGPRGRRALLQRAAARRCESFAEELTPEERDGLHAALLPIVERITPQ